MTQQKCQSIFLRECQQLSWLVIGYDGWNWLPFELQIPIRDAPDFPLGSTGQLVFHKLHIQICECCCTLMAFLGQSHNYNALGLRNHQNKQLQLKQCYSSVHFVLMISQQCCKHLQIPACNLFSNCPESIPHPQPAVNAMLHCFVDFFPFNCHPIEHASIHLVVTGF